MSDNNFGIRELYDVTLRTTYPMEVFGKKLEENEVIFRFDTIQLAIANAVKSRTTANGGYLNRVQVYWEEQKPLQMTLEQGIVNKQGLAIFTNSQFYKEENQSAPMHEIIRLDIMNNKYSLKKTVDFKESYFLYDAAGNKIDRAQYNINNETKEIIFDENFKHKDIEYFIFDYYTSLKVDILRIGQNLLSGFLKLEGKTRLKDDRTGEETTGILVIPRLRIMSDLSMRLGTESEPFMYGFRIEGEPVGGRHDSYIYDIMFLSEDLDAEEY